MPANKVIINGETIIDLTGDSVKPETLLIGETAHDASGNPITGTMEPSSGGEDLEDEISAQEALIDQIKEALAGKTIGGEPTPTQEKTVEIKANGTVEILPDDGYALSKAIAIVSVASSGENKVLNIVANNANYSITADDLQGATKITDYAFYDRTKLISIDIPNTVTSIGKQAFYSCDYLNSVTIGNKVKTIGERAFYGCKALKTLVFPSTLTTINNYVFQNCTAMTEYDFSACTSIPTLGTTVFSGITSSCKIKVPLALVDDWKAATNWSSYASNIVGV